jgi:hypothetical protein
MDPFERPIINRLRSGPSDDGCLLRCQLETPAVNYEISNMTEQSGQTAAYLPSMQKEGWFQTSSAYLTCVTDAS